MKLSDIQPGQFAKVKTTNEVVLGVERNSQRAAFWTRVQKERSIDIEGVELVAVTLSGGSGTRSMGPGYLWALDGSEKLEIELVNVETEENHAA